MKINAPSILFVDDNVNVINGLQRMLRKQSNQWNLQYVSSAEQALDLMQEQQIDLIVTDMMMPNMKGDEFLRIVAEKYPATVRIILSGYADDEALKNGLNVAHQYLCKPCAPDVLKETISQVFKIQQCIQNSKITQCIGDINQLPSLPKIYHELRCEIESDNSSSKSISEIFAKDMALSAKLLQWVNSPYFGFNRKISNLTEAINIIGIRKLTDLVLNAFVSETFKVTSPDLKVYQDYLSIDSLRTAELARLISLSEKQREDRPDQAYLGGLLHNIGLLILMSKLPAKFRVLIGEINHTKESVAGLERKIFGFTHTEAGAYVLGLWKIPPRVIESILLHHHPNETDYEGVNALTAVHVAVSLLKPPIQQEAGRIFDLSLSTEYLDRIGKLDQLSNWERLAQSISEKYSLALG